jgi:hypothetical protein
VTLSLLETLPYWTEADAAELDALTRELVDRVFDHRVVCELCSGARLPCPHVTAAIESVVEWRQRRIQFSRARHLRLGEEHAHVQTQIKELAA